MSEALELAQRCARRMMDRDHASRALGIEVDIPRPGEAVATMTVRDDMLNGFDMCHGGFVFALADTAFAFACNAYDDVSVAAACQIDYLHPVAGGDRLTAHAREDARVGRRGFYTVRVSRGDGELVAMFRGRSSARSKPLLK